MSTTPKNNFIPREKFICKAWNLKHEVENEFNGQQVKSYLIGDNKSTFFVSESDAIRVPNVDTEFHISIKKSDTSKYKLRIKDLDESGKTKRTPDGEYVSKELTMSGNELIEYLKAENVKGITITKERKNVSKIKTYDSKK